MTLRKTLKNTSMVIMIKSARYHIKAMKPLFGKELETDVPRIKTETIDEDERNTLDQTQNLTSCYPKRQHMKLKFERIPQKLKCLVK